MRYGSNGPLANRLKELERQIIAAAVAQTGGNVRRAAVSLGVSRSSLESIINRLKMRDQIAALRYGVSVAAPDAEPARHQDDAPIVSSFDVVSPNGGTRYRLVERGYLVDLVDAHGRTETLPMSQLRLWLACNYVRLEAHVREELAAC